MERCVAQRRSDDPSQRAVSSVVLREVLKQWSLMVNMETETDLYDSFVFGKYR